MFVDHFDWEVPLYQVVDEVLSEDACASLIAKVTAQTWLPATVNGPDGRYLNEKLRDNDLALLQDEDLRQALFARLEAHLPPRMCGEVLHSLHPSLRVYRYQPGQHFGVHSDQPYFDAEGRQSRLTLLVYLDASCVGGQTAFHEIERPTGVVITPRVGRALFFQQNLPHEGMPVISGIKHVLRTDVIYAPE